MNSLLEIPSRHLACEGCKEIFSSGMMYNSILQIRQSLIRKDYCQKCWTPEKNEAWDSHWKSKVPNKKKGKEKNIDKEASALALLRILAKEEEEESQQKAFILGLYLARKRKLYLRQELEAHFLYEDPAAEEMFGIKKFDPSKLNIEKIQHEIAEKLQNIE